MVGFKEKKDLCIKCGEISAFFRAYSGEYLCQKCFKLSIVEKTRRTISKYNMLKYGDKVGIAVSGGKDSLSLLDVLGKLLPKHGEKMVVITVDEGIDNYRDESLELSRRIVSQKDIRHKVVSFKSLFGFTLDEAIAERRDKRISACSICGILRRRAIDVAGKELNLSVITTAHNIDDYLQTFLINLSNGDINRLGYLNPKFKPSLKIPPRVKPFTEIYEKEIAFYAYLSKIPFQTINCPFMNEGIRTEIRDFLNRLENSHPGIKNNIFKTAVKLTETPNIGSISRNCERCSYPSSGKICSSCRMIEIIQNKLSLKTS